MMRSDRTRGSGEAKPASNNIRAVSGVSVLNPMDPPLTVVMIWAAAAGGAVATGVDVGAVAATTAAGVVGLHPAAVIGGTGGGTIVRDVIALALMLVK